MQWIKRLVLFSIFMGLAGIAAIVAIYYLVKSDLPDVATITEIQLQVPMKVYSIDGELLSQFGEKRRIPLTKEDIPEMLTNAFIAIEDSRFHQHFGIDPIGIMRAVSVWVSTGSATQGASTITQQVARNFFLTRDRTFIRKIKEVFIAVQLEQILTKDEIMMLYLNKIALGQRAYGIGAAAQVYYGKNVSELTLAEMAVLAGLPKAPSNLNPITSPKNAKMRRNVVLFRMLSENYITQDQYETAKTSPITATYHGAEITLSAHYVAEIARNKLIELYGSERSYNEGFNVYTTINKIDQQAANKATLNNLHDYDKRHGYRGASKVLWQAPAESWSTEAILSTLSQTPDSGDLHPAVVVKVTKQAIKVITKSGQGVLQQIDWDGLKWARPFITNSRQGDEPKKASEIVAVGQQIWVREVAQKLELSQYPDASAAFVSLNPQDGAITSMVGGFSFEQSKFNRATQAQRQVGSNIKPFIYSAALDNGYTLATLVNDAPINEWAGSTAWRPKNSPEVYAGPIRLRQAMGQSKNVVSVRLVQDLGLTKVTNQLEKYGFERKNLPQNNTIALGSASISPLSLATGYAIIANGGFRIEPYLIERIENAYGSVIYQANPKIVCSDCAELYTQQENNQPFIATQTALDKGANICPISPVSAEQIAPAVISAETSFLTRELLKTAIWGGGSWQHNSGWNGTGWRAGRALKRHDMGGKTGTTNGSKDAWFSGFAGHTVATSWVGFDDFNLDLGRTSYNNNLDKDQSYGSEFGAKTAQPAWIEFMQETASSNPVVTVDTPSNISTVRIDRNSGLLTYQTDHNTLFEYFRADSVPSEYVNRKTVFKDKTLTEDNQEILYNAPTSVDELF
ncbi:penicillin-binding protein 1A [Psychromonas sp. MB-3u-54]|uniref:penicillin-binding protein 1A n=1 Tax=Psychromonas sp. MB-3u-54 TaxID=2058319 RepID=UPI0018E36CBD|nr:PBP1A family penicillin-binding protein [Psychromonas sp. MB-3u-54]